MSYRKTVNFVPTTDAMFSMKFTSAFTTFHSRVRDWWWNTVQPGARVTYYYGSTVVGYHGMTSTGWSKFSSVHPDRTAKFVPSYGEWSFNVVNRSTPYWSSSRMTAVASATFIKGPETQWPNIATPFAFRQIMLVSSAHTVYPKDYLMNCQIRTGGLRIAGRNGHYNESIVGGKSIVYFSNKTHIAWREESGAHYGRSFSHVTKSFGPLVYISDSLNAGDSHYQTNIEVDKSGYIHYLHNSHGSAPLYYMFATANDLSSRKIHTANIAEGTYHVLCATNDNALYAFARTAVGNSQYGYDLKRRCHTSNVWTGVHTVCISTIYAGGNSLSWYSNGPYIDNVDRIHATLCMDENYGASGLQYNTHMFYIYSPPSLISANTSEPGHYWFAANGSVVAILTNNTTSPMRFRSATAHAAIIATCANNWYTRHSNISFSANVKCAMIANSRQPYVAGSKTNYRPYHAFSIDASADPAGCVANVAWYNPSAPNANSHGWVIRNLTTAVALTYGSSVRPWNHRTYGSMLIDHKNIIRVYGSVAKDYRKASAWWGGEIFEWYSEDLGENWKGRFLTDRSSIGLGMLDTKHNMENQMVELAFCRGRDIHYYSDGSVFPHFRDDGNDIAVIFNGTTTPKLIDSVADYYNFSTSNVTFKLHTSIPRNYSYSTAGQYAIYYGRRISTPLASDPRQIYVVYDNFEQGTQDVSTGLFTGVGTNPNGWNYFAKKPYATAAVSTSAWRIVGSYQNDPVNTLKSVLHTNKIYAGGRALLSWVGTSEGKQFLTTCYVYTGVPTKWKKKIAIEGSIWYEDPGSNNAMIGFTVGSNHTIVGVRLSQTGKFGYFDGTNFLDTPASVVATEAYPDYNRMHRFKAQIIGTAFTCYANNFATAIGYVNLPYQCSAQRAILCRTNTFSRAVYQGGKNFYDYVMVYPVIS